MSKAICRFLGVVVLVVGLILGTVDLSTASSGQNASRFNLSPGRTFQTTADRIHQNVSYTFTLVNGSSREVFVRKFGANGPGLKLLVPHDWTNLRTIGPHKSIGVTVRYHIGDCNEVPRTPWPLPLEVSLKTGKWQLASLHLLSAGSIQWQKFLADAVCP
jgi:hypothetical protein